MTAAAINPAADPSSIERLHAEIMRILPDPQRRKLLDLIENDAGGDSKLYKLDTLYQRILSRGIDFVSFEIEGDRAMREMIRLDEEQNKTLLESLARWDDEREEAFRKMMEEVNL